MKFNPRKNEVRGPSNAECKNNLSRQAPFKRVFGVPRSCLCQNNNKKALRYPYPTWERIEKIEYVFISAEKKKH